MAESMTVAAGPALAPSALRGLGRLPVVKQVVLLLALASSIALGVGVALWSRDPGYAPLYGSLSGRDAAAVAEALERARIPVRIEEGTGAILVPRAKIHAARLELASQGLPEGNDEGFELLGQRQSFGTSEFIERARYQHALEVELARTIAAFDTVAAARVHLALPRQSAFLKRNRAPSASVLISLAPGRRLEEGQAAAIAHLVAAAVPNLEPGSVRVVDERGRLLSAPDELGSLGISRRQLDYRQRLEAAYIKRIEDILTPIIGADGVRAQVAAELDFTATERSRESYDPDLPALRSEQVLEEQGTEADAGGVPGALSNQPPPAGVAPETTSDGAQTAAGPAGAAASRRREATRNYELDRTVSHSRTPAGRLRRLSVAVVVDHARVAGPDGTSRRVPRSPEEIARISSLVEDAIGFDAARGDSVNVTNVAFTDPEIIAPPPEPPLWRQPWVIDVARQAGAALVVLIVLFGILRPLMRNLAGRDEAERRLEERLASLAPPDGAPATGADTGAEGAAPALPAAARPEEQILSARTLISQDPARAATVVREWIAADE